MTVHRLLHGSTLALALGTLLCGCAVGPRYARPSAPTSDTYKEAKGWSTAAPADALDRGSWWELFHDPVLDDLEGRVDVSNQNVAAAVAAYTQARALVREQQAAYFPAVTLDAGATRSSGSRAGVSVGSSVGGSTVVQQSGSSVVNTYQANVSASWELDVWGRLRRTVENARSTAQASAADLAAARLAAQGQLASDYFQLRETDAEYKLLQSTVEGYKRSLQITQNSYNAKIAAKSDVLQAQTQLANAEDQAVGLEQQRATLEHAIAVLVGEAPGQFALTAADWTPTVPDVPVAVPSTLLQRRPDIAGAERRVAAANAEIGVQEAGYFPDLTLTGSYGSATTELSELLSAPTRIWSAGAAIAQTVFDAGLTRARTAAARAAYEQSVATYRQTVLTAFQNVEDNLAASRVLARQYELLQEASTAADQTERITLNQYQSGLVAYTSVVVAQVSALSARRSLVQTAVSRQTTAIALIQALGGGWTAPQ